MSRVDALALAAKYGLENEISYAINNRNCDPMEALEEWDII